MRKLFLHIGVHRTATSSLQKFLRDNEKVLLSHGYLYPYSAPRHAAQIEQIVSGGISAADFAIDLLRQVEQASVPVDAVILSDEDISLIADPSILAGLQKMFEVKIVVSLRRQDLWLESWYLQNVKWQWNPRLAHLTFDDFFAQRDRFFWIDYAAHLGRYEAVFGLDAVLVSVFETSSMPDGPIAAFLRLLGISDLTGFGPFLTINSSLSPMMTEFVRHLPLDTMRRIERAMFEKAIARVDAQLPKPSSKLLLTYDQRLDVIFSHADGNRSVAQRYFDRSTLFLEPIPHRDTPLADQTLPDTPLALMQLLVAPMVQELGAGMQKERLSKKTNRDPLSGKK